MPIIEESGIRYGLDRKREMFYKGLYVKSMGFDRLFTIRKINKQSECNLCEKNITKGNYAYGYKWFNICIGCYEEYCDNSIKTLKGLITMIKESKNGFLEHKKGYEDHNLITDI